MADETAPLKEEAPSPKATIKPAVVAKVWIRNLTRQGVQVPLSSGGEVSLKPGSKEEVLKSSVENVYVRNLVAKGFVEVFTKK